MSPTPQGVIAVGVILPTFSTFAVVLRIYVRRMKDAHLQGDDWTILLALFLTWTLGIMLIVGAAIGSFGGHTKINPVTGADVVTIHEQNAVKLEFSSYLVMSMTFGVIKLSVLLLYRRLFLGRLFNRYSLAMCAVIILWSLSFFFAFAFQCHTDIVHWWTSAATIEKYCDNTNALNLAFVISDVLTDLMILIIPIPIVWKLQMSTTTKIGLTGIFLLGLLATASGVTRMVIVILDIYETTTGYRDLRGIVTNVVVWSQVEAAVAVIAACLPTIRPLFLGKSPESLIGSIRSMLSLNSVGRSQHPTERRGSDSEALASGVGGIHMDPVRVSESKSYLQPGMTMETQVTSGDVPGYVDDKLPAGQIGVQNGISFKEEYLKDLEAQG